MKISVLLPVFNVEKYVERCVKSLLEQTCRDFEVIVVNDGTEDKSMDLIKEQTRQDSRFVLIDHEINKGLMEARRTGYLHAQGDYVVFCDSDDWLPVDALEVLLEAIEKTGADIVVGQMKRIYSNGEEGKINQRSLLYGNKPKAIYKSLLKQELPHNLCGCIYRRSIFDSSLLCRSNFNNAEDGLLFYQLIQRISKMELIDKVVYFYYQNMNSSSNIKLADRQICNILFFRNYIAQYFREDRELWLLYENLFVKIVVGLLKIGVPKKLILQNVTGIELNMNTLCKVAGRSKDIFVLLFYYSNWMRRLYVKLRKWRQS